jgi:4-hydroxyproline epimerase
MTGSGTVMTHSNIGKVHVIDSHTGGEPTRVVVSGGPKLVPSSLSARVSQLRDEFDQFRSAVVNEPRGHEAVVGALLCEPQDPTCSAGVIFFNNVGYLGMCGHGTIGLAATLAYLGRWNPGLHRIETPVGVVEAELHDTNQVTVNNVPSYRLWKGVKVPVSGFGEVCGDVAWGGNWFFLTNDCPVGLEFQNIEALTNYAWDIRQTLQRNGITGADGQEIDHIEVSGRARSAGCHSRNFVLCPGKSYDRSPCGTGTSAKLACLHADGRLAEGEIWRQESIVGSVFEGSVIVKDHLVHPRIKGSAWITAEAHLVFDRRDPFCWGIRP